MTTEITTWVCNNDRYCGDTTEFESVEEFQSVMAECFGDDELGELRWGRDRDGTEVYRDERDEIVLEAVAD